MLHNRRAFSPCNSKSDAELEVWLWAIESMSSLKVRRVCFVVEAKDLLNAVCRPAAWPSFKFQPELIFSAFRKVNSWRLIPEERCANKGAFLIARNVTFEDRRQSYVASGYPFWLHKVSTEEMCIA